MTLAQSPDLMLGASPMRSTGGPIGMPKFFSRETGKDEEDRQGDILLIDPRALDRECLSRSLAAQSPHTSITAVGSIEEYRRTPMEREPAAVLLIIGGRKIFDPAVSDEIVDLVSEFSKQPVILVADSDDLGQILHALELGVRGYIPSNVGVSVAAEAVALARAGGVFVPASSVLAIREIVNASSAKSRQFGNLFTAREAEVADALKRGKANKIIAYELNLCESTVKVHVRNIMKKLKASNRTEVAFKIREMMA